MAEAGENLSSVDLLQQENTELRLDNARLASLLTFDELTGLFKTSEFGRKVILERMQEAQTVGDNVVVAVVDLTKFRDVNNAFNHATGDEVLKTVAAKLGKLAGSNGLAMRSHSVGDEFGVLFVGEHGKEGVTSLQDIQTIGIPWKAAKAEGKISFTLGISSLDELTDDQKGTPGEVFQHLWQRASDGEREQHRSQNG